MGQENETSLAFCPPHVARAKLLNCVNWMLLCGVIFPMLYLCVTPQTRCVSARVHFTSSWPRLTDRLPDLCRLPFLLWCRTKSCVFQTPAELPHLIIWRKSALRSTRSAILLRCSFSSRTFWFSSLKSDASIKKSGSRKEIQPPQWWAGQRRGHRSKVVNNGSAL